MMKRKVPLLLLLLVSVPGLSSAQGISILKIPDCVDGRPWDLYVVNADSDIDCDPAPPNGTSDAHCRCMDGVIAAVTSGVGGGAPTTLDYFVGTSTGSLSAERVGTDTASIDVDLGTAGQVKFNVITPVASASDLSGCTNCIGGAEVDESTLGAVPTATAFAVNPGDCGIGEYAFRIAANGDLSCDVPTGSGLSHQQVMARLAVGGGF